MANTRALDRILLELFPAIGRNHISELFFDSASVEKEAASNYHFLELLDHCFDICDCVSDQIESTVDINTLNFSGVKTIDNSIIAYVQRNLKSS